MHNGALISEWARKHLADLLDVLCVELKPGLRVVDLLNLEDLRDLVTEAGLDSHLERHGGAGAGAAGALEHEHDDEAVDRSR